MPLYKRFAQSPTKLFVQEQARLKQFHGIPDQTLFRLAERATGFAVEDRWVAIALIMRNPLPIPVIRKDNSVVKHEEPTTPPRFIVIQGGKHSQKSKAASAGNTQ